MKIFYGKFKLYFTCGYNSLGSRIIRLLRQVVFDALRVNNDPSIN